MLSDSPSEAALTRKVLSQHPLVVENIVAQMNTRAFYFNIKINVNATILDENSL